MWRAWHGPCKWSRPESVERAVPVVHHLIELARLRAPFDATDVARFAEEAGAREGLAGLIAAMPFIGLALSSLLFYLRPYRWRILVVAAWGVTRMHVETDLSARLAPDNPLRRAQTFVQQRLSAGADDVRIAAPRPVAGDGISQRPGRCELAASRAVRADKLGIAKPANGAGAIPLAAGPEIAAREAQEHRRAPGPGALTLQREVNFPD